MIKVKAFIFMSIFVLLTISCQTEEKEPIPIIKNCFGPVHYVDVIDTSTITIIPLSSATWLDENYTQTTLSIAELFELDTLLTESCFAYNIEVRKKHAELVEFYREEAEFMGEEFVEWEFQKGNLILDLSNYRRQYVPYFNEVGEKMVLVYCNCLLYNAEDWKTTILVIHDGGNCHFDAILNLTTGKCERLSVNGHA